MSFSERLKRLSDEKKTDLALLLRPQMAKLPLPIQRYDDPFLPFSREILNAAQRHVSVVIFDLAAYLALGAAGAVALERALAAAVSRGEVLTILHAPFATPDYAAATSALAFAPDGVTMTTPALIPAYMLRHQAGAVVFGSDEGDPAYSTLNPALNRLRIYTPEGVSALRVVGDEAVYAGRLDDFAEQTTAALAALRHMEKGAS